MYKHWQPRWAPSEFEQLKHHQNLDDKGRTTEHSNPWTVQLREDLRLLAGASEQFDAVHSEADGDLRTSSQEKPHNSLS